MALNLYVSNDLNALADKLIDNLSNNDYDVLQPYTIVTQTEGMNNWLTFQIAEKKGIASNINFYKPGALIKYLFWKLVDEREQVISKDILDWLIYKILGAKEFGQLFPDKAYYFESDNIIKNQKRMALAQKLADLFDQYQIYRTEEVQKWTNQKLENIDLKYQWQAYIWKQLFVIADNQVPDMTNISEKILAQLKNTSSDLKVLNDIKAINFFGLSIITQYHINIFYELSKKIDINFYLLNPAPYIYWTEDKSEKEILKIIYYHKYKDNTLPIEGNSLLANWGKVLQNTFGMLYQTEEFINHQEEVNVQEPERNSLLGKIKNDIFNNAIKNITFRPQDLDDGSIVINCCYTRVREIETLYNYIITILNENQDHINMRDILVMVNNIEAYAPYIRAIFKGASYKLPFNITDESVAQGDTPISCLIELLSLKPNELTAENVLHILEYSVIQYKFGIYNLKLIRDTVKKANIRFGIENEIENDTYVVSWRNGINRIMYGICIEGAPLLEFENKPSFIGMDTIESSEDTDQILRFVGFVQELLKTIQYRSEDRKIEEWVAYIYDILSHFIDAEIEKYQDDIKIINTHLNNYLSLQKWMTEAVPFEVISRHLTSELSLEVQSQTFSSRGITFCSQIPMRSIPFKVIAMLGLSFKDFPRKDSKLDFDLLQEKRRLGDRSIKDNDKHLFLESLLSAKEKIYFSYIGKSVKDNSTFPPSILLDELLDYIQNGINNYTIQNSIDAIDVRQKLITVHPLHSFSMKYNKGNPKLVNYLYTLPDTTLSFIDNNKPEVIQQIKEISIDTLLKYVSNTLRYYYNEVLGVYLNDEDITISDSEVFNLSRLEKYNIKVKLKQLILDNMTLDDSIRTRLLKNGQLPLGNYGALLFDELSSEIINNYNIVSDALKPLPLVQKDVKLIIDQITISGTIENIKGDTLIYLSLSHNIEKAYLLAYIQLLLGVASDQFYKAIFVHNNALYQSSEITKIDAEKNLSELLKIIRKHYNKPSVFSYKLLNDIEKIIHDDEKMKKHLNNKVENENYDQYLLNLRDKDMIEESYNLALIRDLYNLLYNGALDCFSINKTNSHGSF